MKALITRKLGMTSILDEKGAATAVTLLSASPNVVTQLKTDETDGYGAVQLGFENSKRPAKAQAGHFKPSKTTLKVTREFRITGEEDTVLAVGDQLAADSFSVGDIVKVTGISKGKGFQGVVKRHGFSGSPATHGHKDQLRMPGSIGAGGPQHVFKGTRMGGRMGGSQVTVKNLEVIEVDPEKNEIFIKGAVPGPRNNLLLLSGVGDIIIEQVVKEETVKPEENKMESKDQLAQPAQEVNEQSKPKAGKEVKAAAITAAADQAAKQENK